MLTQGNVRIPYIPTKGKQISHFPIMFEELKRDSSRLQKLMFTLVKNLIAGSRRCATLCVCTGVCKECDDSVHILLPSLSVCRPMEVINQPAHLSHTC